MKHTLPAGAAEARAFACRSLVMLVIASLLLGGDASAATRRPPQLVTNLGIGVNIPDLAADFLEPSYRIPEQNAVRRRMGLKAIADAYHVAGARSIAIFMPGFYPSSSEDLHLQRNDLRLWQTNPTLYWQRVDAMIAAVRQYGMTVIIRGWDDNAIFPTLTGETTRDIVTNPNSKAFALYKTYWGQFLARYRNTGAVALYEGPLEMNTYADLDMVSACRSQNKGLADEALLCANVGNYSTDEMDAYSARIVAFFKSVDPAALIASNMTVPRAQAQHLRQHPQWTGATSWANDTEPEFATNLTDINAAYDVVDVHVYNGLSGNALLRFGYGGSDPANPALLGLIGQIAGLMNKHVYYGEFGDTYAPDFAKQNFTKNVIAQMPDANTIGSDLWGFEFYQFNTYQFQPIGNGYSWDYDAGDDLSLWTLVRHENEAFGHAEYAGLTPLPPEVIISYPFTGTKAPYGSLLYIQASAAVGRIGCVVVDIDGKAYKTLKTWPYMTTILESAGTHHVTVTAYDSAGGKNTDSITVAIVK